MEKRGRGRPKKQTFETLQAERLARFAPAKTQSGWKICGLNAPTCPYLTALLFGFKHARDFEEREFFFWQVADQLWNKDPDDPRFIRNKWSWRIIRECCREDWLAIGGSASSGKSYVLAGWAIISWLADPSNTLVMVTSTDLKGARKRIYGAIKKLLRFVPNPPCKIKDSIGVIAYYDGTTAFDTAGIQIITADKSKNAQDMGKIVGAKAPKVILIADEHDEMGPNVTAAAKGNLKKNPQFQMVSLSNPGSRFGSFGEFAEPALGWDSIDVFTDEEWRTKMKGLYLRLNSEDSPNIDVTPNAEYEVGHHTEGVITQEDIDDDLDVPGLSPDEVRKTRNFMRFNSAVFFDGDETETVYSESELIRAGATERIALRNVTKFAGVDPSYSDGGDNTVMVVCEEGFDEYGQHCIQIKDIEYIAEDMTDKVNPRTLQIAEKIKKLCAKHGVAYENLGIDATSGAGTGICDMLRLQIDSNAFLRVHFGGSASDKRISSTSKITGKQRYKNRASELFFQGKQYLLGRQMFGIPPIIAKQICQRICLEPKKGEHGLIFQVEPKKIYKSRVGSSPDEADAFFVCVETARVRRMFTANDPVPQRAKQNIAGWLQGRKTHASYAADKMGFVAGLN